MIKKLYPGGRDKAFSLSYDDGTLQDVRLVGLLNHYGLKGTFNLNSGLMEQEFEWTHPCGLTVKRLSQQQAADLYHGHEIASHTRTHPYMQSLGREELLRELREDKQALERLFHKPVNGFAVPFDYYSDRIEQCVRECGFAYARISEESGTYQPDTDYYRWRAGIFHLDPALMEFVEGFLHTNEELALCQIAGHAYDIDAENLWGTLEEIFCRVSRDASVCSMTTDELIGYLRAMNQAQLSEEVIRNPSDTRLWFAVNNASFCVEPHTVLSLDVFQEYEVRKA